MVLSDTGDKAVLRQMVNSNALPFRPSLSLRLREAYADAEAGRAEEATLAKLKEGLGRNRLGRLLASGMT